MKIAKIILTLILTSVCVFCASPCDITRYDNNSFIAKDENDPIRAASIFTHKNNYSYLAFAFISYEPKAIIFNMGKSVDELNAYDIQPYNTFYKEAEENSYHQLPFWQEVDKFGMYCWKTQVLEDKNCVFNTICGNELKEAKCFYANKSLADLILKNCHLIKRVCFDDDNRLVKDLQVYIREMLFDQNAYRILDQSIYSEKQDSSGKDHIIIQLNYTNVIVYFINSTKDWSNIETTAAAIEILF